MREGLLMMMVLCLVQAQQASAQDQQIPAAQNQHAPAQSLPSEVPEPDSSAGSEAKTESAENGNKTTPITRKKSTKKKKSRRVAAVRSEIVLGVAAVDNRKPGEAVQFGKFTGVTDGRVYLIGAADIQSHNGRRYWNLKADDLGLANRSINFDGGTMAKYKLHFGYSELDNLLSSTSQTPFNGAGETVLTLPTVFAPAPTTAGMTELAASLKPVELGTQRKEGDVSFAYRLDPNLGLAFSFRRYQKNGTKSMGTLFRDDSSGPQSMTLPEPVNYQTDEFRTVFDWQGERGQASMEYYYSRFVNNDASLTWDNPFSDSSNPQYPVQGRNSLPPDNQHQRLSLSGSFRLAPSTRLSALLERGMMTQDEAFLPYTINSQSIVTIPLPRSSPQARIDTSLFKLDLVTQPLSALSLHAGYRYYDTDNQTPRDLYQMVINDWGNQVPLVSPAARYNQPFGYSQSQFKLDGAYHMGRGSTLKLGYDRDQKDYQYRAVNSTTEDTYSARLTDYSGIATSFISAARSTKRADSYDEARHFENIHSQEYLDYIKANPPVAYYDNLPGMRQFDVADRNRQRYGLGTTLGLRPDLTVGINANRQDDKYPSSQFGLQQQKTANYTIDATLVPDDASSWSIYYTRQDIEGQQSSWAYDFGQKNNGNLDTTNIWSASQQDIIDTVGINIAFSFLDESLPVRFGYAYANINTDISFYADPASPLNAPYINMPTLEAVRQTIDLSGTYSLSDNLSVRGGAMVEIYRAKDWATDEVPPGSTVVPEVLTLSGSATPYQVILLSLALSYHF